MPKDPPVAPIPPAGSPEGADGTAETVVPSITGDIGQQAAGGAPSGATAPPAATDPDRVALEVATIERHLSELKRNRPVAGPFGHDGLSVQLWRERVARVERELERLRAALAPADEETP